MLKVCALLESMWGWGGYHAAGDEAPRFFRINPDNFSGRRLYRICGEANLIVTNSCRIVQRRANDHGNPDPQWVKENLTRAHANGCDLFLVCGKVAQATFERAFSVADRNLVLRHIYMDHPAARRWTNEKLDALKAQIAAHAPTA